MADSPPHAAWHRGHVLAHSVWAAVDAARLSATGPGLELRRAAVALPSLIGDALLGIGDQTPAEVLARCREKLQEVERLLDSAPLRQGLADADREGLLEDVGALLGELERVAVGRQA